MASISQGRSAAWPRPRHLGLQSPVLLALDAWPPWRRASVRCPARSPDAASASLSCREPKDSPHRGQANWLALLEVQPQHNCRRSTSISLLTTFHPLPKPSASLKKISTFIDSSNALSILRAPALPAWPQDTLIHSLPPERLPRRAVRGLGAHSPHPTRSFHRLVMSRSRLFRRRLMRGRVTTSTFTTANLFVRRGIDNRHEATSLLSHPPKELGILPRPCPSRGCVCEPVRRSTARRKRSTRWLCAVEASPSCWRGAR